jgi:hypothetical protein
MSALLPKADIRLCGLDVRFVPEADIAVDDPFGQRQYDATKAVPEGSVTIEDYDFPKPGTSESVPKESYMTRVGDQGCGVGYYK